ncbi:35484_t:CDS:2, partial [Gigaspora margarita]
DSVVAIAISQLKEVLKEYSLKDIYNIDEMNLEPVIIFTTTRLKDKQKTKRILLVQNNEDKDEDPINNDNNDKLIEKMKANIELFNFRNAINLEVYFNYLKKKDTSEVLNVTNIESTEDLSKDNNSEEDKNNSKKISMITYHKVLNAIEILEQYLIQQNLSKTAQLDYDQALLNLQKAIRKI